MCSLKDSKPNGEISIIFRRNARGRTYMAKQYFKIPLQVLKPHYYDVDGTAIVYLLNPSGGVLQHDRLLTSIVSEAGTDAIVTTPGNSKYYKMDEGCAGIRNDLYVHKGGVLEYLPEHNVPFAHSEVYQENEFHIEKGGVLFAADMVTAGRVASGEVFQYRRYASKTCIYADGELQLYDNCSMEPGEEDLRRTGLLEGRLSNGTFYAYAESISQDLCERINELNTREVRLAAGKITPDLMVVRFIGDSIIEMTATMHKVWGLCRQSILGKPGIHLRKEFSYHK
jgi:urease accessory protein